MNTKTITINLNFSEIELTLFELNGAYNQNDNKQLSQGILQEKLSLLSKMKLTEFSDTLLEKYESIKKTISSKEDNPEEELKELFNKKWEFSFETINKNELNKIDSNNNYPFLWKLKIFE